MGAEADICERKHGAACIVSQSCREDQKNIFAYVSLQTEECQNQELQQCIQVKPMQAKHFLQERYNPCPSASGIQLVCRAPEEWPWLNKAPFLPPLPSAGSDCGSPPPGTGAAADLLWRHASTTNQLTGKLSAFLPRLSRSPFSSACPTTRGCTLSFCSSLQNLASD